MRLVLDTTVLVAVIRSEPGASRHILIAALEKRYVPLLSAALVPEYESVLTRREHLKAARLSAGDVHKLLDALVAVSEPVNPSFVLRPMLPDADDDMVFEAALYGQADLLVTFNRSDFEPFVSSFKIAVVSPAEALAQVRKSHEKK